MLATAFSAWSAWAASRSYAAAAVASCRQRRHRRHLRRCFVALRDHVDRRAASRAATSIADGVAARSMQRRALGCGLRSWLRVTLRGRGKAEGQASALRRKTV